jgi:hypothetical protein
MEPHNICGVGRARMMITACHSREDRYIFAAYLRFTVSWFVRAAAQNPLLQTSPLVRLDGPTSSAPR